MPRIPVTEPPAAEPLETVTGTSSPTRRVNAATGEPTPDTLDGEGIVQTGRFGRYEVLGQLGAGGMGIVLEARDPALDRKVALKLLRPRRNRSADDGARRLAVEAQAMARLAHPNVVTVFEIDRVGDQVYVAMELVAGTTLRGWLRERPRRWREIVEMFIAAGRGLAAAHAAGLIHRDFKPDNVLIGSDGRARVCDFGLVVETDHHGDDIENLDSVAGHVTVRGSVIGTPAYMSAEQWLGQVVDWRSDQFAFCVALWEALCKSRPFSGGRPKEVRAAVCSGVLNEPPRRPAPRWLLAMLRRGLAVAPRDRWPDMATLLDALERRTRAGRRWAIAASAAGVALASAAIAVAVVGARAAPDPCAPPGERIAAVWSAARGAAVRAKLVAADPVQGAGRFAKIALALDTGAQAWSDMHVAACRATRVDGRQSDTLLDRRMECLDRWLVELSGTVDVIAGAKTPADVDKVVHAATSLSPLDACADVRALAAAPPPGGGAERARAIELANQTRELTVAQRAGRLDGAAARAAELVAAARSLGHAPTLAGALVVQVQILNTLAGHAGTEPILRELIEVAARGHDDRDEAFAWMQLIVMTANNKGETDNALALVPSARAAVLRAGDPVDLRADLLYAHAIVLDYSSRPSEGLVLLQDARQLLERAGAGSPTSPLAVRLGDVLYEIATSYMRADQLDAAIAASHESIQRWRAIAGADSTDEAYSWQNLSVALQRSGRLDEALAAIREAVRLREARLGDSVALALTLVVEAATLGELGRWDAAVAIYERALRMGRATIAPGDVMFGHALLNSGVALVHVGRAAEAQRNFDEAIALFGKGGGDNVNLAIAIYSRGDLSAQRGRCADAIADFDHALAVLDKLTEESYVALYPLSGKGACLVRTGRPAEAIPLLERALQAKASGGDAFEVARARAYLGRALVETRRDVTGGLAMVRAARPGIASSPYGVEEVRSLDRWLAAHPR